MPIAPSSVLALDVGSKRVGVAVASMIARLPRPLTTLEHNPDFFGELAKIITAENIGTIVVGLPRSLNGQHTAQTITVEDFTDKLRRQFPSVPIHFQDEALTSHHAEAELEHRGQGLSPRRC